MKIRFNTQYVYSFIITYMLSFLALLNLGNEIFNTLGLHTTLDTAVMYGVLLISVLLGFVLTFADRDRFKPDVLAVLAFFVFAFFTSASFRPLNLPFIFTSVADYAGNPVYIFFIYALPCYIFVRQLKSYECLHKLMKGFSYTVVAMSVFVFFFAKGSTASQYMTFSYNMLTQLLFLIAFKPKKHKFLHYTMICLGAFALIFGGARGAMVFLLVGCIILYLFNHKATVKSVLLMLTASFSVLMFAIFKSAILVFVGNLLTKLSIDSRNFSFLLGGNLLDNESRALIYKNAIEDIGFFGKGVMGDRALLNIYPHNIFLELLIHFGYVLGLALCAALVALIVKAVLKRNRPELIYIILLLPCGLFKLLVTGSYLNQEPAFYALLGMCLNAVVRREQQCE